MWLENYSYGYVDMHDRLMKIKRGLTTSPTIASTKKHNDKMQHPSPYRCVEKIWSHLPSSD